jgi:hypothetical protein
MLTNIRDEFAKIIETKSKDYEKLISSVYGLYGVDKFPNIHNKYVLYKNICYIIKIVGERICYQCFIQKWLDIDEKWFGEHTYNLDSLEYSPFHNFVESKKKELCTVEDVFLDFKLYRKVVIDKECATDLNNFLPKGEVERIILEKINS